MELAEHLRPGEWVGGTEPLLEAVDIKGWEVEGFIAEEDLDRVHVGTMARFFPEHPAHAMVPCQVAGLDRRAMKRLDDPLLSASHGGRLPTREERDGRFMIEGSFSRVRLKPLDSPPPATPQLRGTVVLEGEKISPLVRGARHVLGVFLRESGF